MFDSVYDSNVQFSEAAGKTVYGIAAWNIYDYQKFMTDCVSFNKVSLIFFSQKNTSF